MAVVRARSSPPYGLFAAVAFAVIATGAAVIFYVMWSKSVDEHDKAVAALNKVVSDKEMRQLVPTLVSSYDDNKTLISQLNAQIAKLSTDLAASKRALDQVTVDRDSRQTTVDRVNVLAKSASDRATAAERAKGDIQKTFDAQISTLQQQINKLNAQIGGANALHDKAVADAQAALNKSLEEAELQRRELVLKLEDAQSQINKATAEIFDLRQRIINQGGKADVLVGEPDGRIIRVNGVSGEVYINLGKNDRMVPGMPFTAYDPRIGVRFGTDETALGNGSLEVIEVGETTSICRITRTSTNKTIQANDLIANIVYHNDKTRKFRFTVFGDFDLDGDGVATAAERDRLIVLIQRWGGQVDDEVTSQTDYLVLGNRPASPVLQDTGDTPATGPAATGPAAVIPGSISEVRTKDQGHWDELQVSAKRLAIPVLNANRFLAMVGYYNTTVIRY